ncbi:MAG TPA: S8 family serine peptidase [Kofleriaceae bacterium]|nr:S8 family serine peptidase [Kofleriaceae bacterium]
MQLRRRSASRQRIATILGGAALAALAGWGCSPSTKSGDGDQAGDDQSGGQGGAASLEFAKDSVIVRFRTTPTASGLRSSLTRVKGSIEDKNNDGVYDRFAHLAKGQLAVVRLDKNSDVDAAIAQLRQDPEIAYAERNYIVHALATPNDPRFPELYGMNNTGQTGGVVDADIDAVEAWDNSVGSSDIVVAVVDTGVDYNHEDLAANMWVNPAEIPGNGVDDDANGVIDDVHGFNAITGSGDPLDDHDHGSHCSGTIGGVGNNGIGVTGVNWEVNIMALKFLDAGGSGTLEDAISAIDYGVAQRNAGVNLRVMSNSWSGGGFSQGLLDAITSASDAGILFVAAAGNASNDNDVTPTFPASYEAPNVVAVAATDANDQLADFSSFGATSVDLGAPGVDVLSTTRNNTYQLFSGTSMATPHVAGVAALVLSANDTLTVEELKDVLLTSGDPIPALAGVTLSGRRLNAASALDEAGPPIPRFNMAVTPPSVILAQGDTASYDVGVTSVAGFTGDVSLSVTADPAIDATLDITPVVTAPGAGTLTVATTTATAPGIYNLTITGTSGELTKSRTVSLRVRPFGTVDVPFPSTDTPIAIPDNDPVGINSVLNVPQSIVIDEVAVEVNITHTFVGDLIITLTSPAGTTVTLHDRAGGGSDDLHQTFAVPTAFLGQDAAGSWVMNVSDNAGIDIGTLDNWTLHVIGVPGAATFGVTASPASQTVSQGASTTFDVAVSSFGGFAGDVALSLTSAPELAASATFSPASVTAPGSSSLTIATDCATAAGTYALTITGTGTDGTSKTANVSLTVQPFGNSDSTFPSTDTPIDIPDNTPAGISSTINVADDVQITGLGVEVNITHTFIGDLIVSLVAPDGTTVVLHNRTGGAADDIHETFPVPDFVGSSTAGAWQLLVSDNAGIDIGSLDDWSLHVTGAPSTQPPVASFTFTGENATFSFTDTSADSGCGGGTIVGWAWDFGDGSTSAEQNPTHTYAEAGTYTVTLTVTDNDGLTGSASQTVDATRVPPVLSIQNITRDRTRFEFRVQLRWSGATGDLVELYRNDVLVDIPNNDGAQGDIFRRYETAYTWQICEQFSTFCSNTVSVDFGPNFDAPTATVTTVIAGQTTTKIIAIVDEN